MSNIINFFGYDKKEKKLVSFSNDRKLKDWLFISIKRVRLTKQNFERYLDKPYEYYKEYLIKHVDEEIGSDDYKPMDEIIKNRKPYPNMINN